MIRRRVRILNHDKEMIYPFDIQYAHPGPYGTEEADDYGKPIYASYYYENEDWITGEKNGKFTQASLKIWKYDDHLPIMYNLGPRDTKGVFIYEKDLVKGNDGLTYLVDYDEVKCYHYLELPDGQRKPISEVDLTTFEVVGDIYNHRKELFVKQ